MLTQPPVAGFWASALALEAWQLEARKPFPTLLLALSHTLGHVGPFLAYGRGCLWKQESPQPCFFGQTGAQDDQQPECLGPEVQGGGASPPRVQCQLLLGHTGCPLWLPPPLLSTAPGLCAKGSCWRWFLVTHSGAQNLLGHRALWNLLK